MLALLQATDAWYIDPAISYFYYLVKLPFYLTLITISGCLKECNVICSFSPKNQHQACLTLMDHEHVIILHCGHKATVIFLYNSHGSSGFRFTFKHSSFFERICSIDVVCMCLQTNRYESGRNIQGCSR